MSAPQELPAPPIARAAATAPPEALDQPAGAFLAGVPWEGPAPDPDALAAAAFLAWL